MRLSALLSRFRKKPLPPEPRQTPEQARRIVEYVAKEIFDGNGIQGFLIGGFDDPETKKGEVAMSFNGMTEGIAIGLVKTFTLLINSELKPQVTAAMIGVLTEAGIAQRAEMPDDCPCPGCTARREAYKAETIKH